MIDFSSRHFEEISLLISSLLSYDLSYAISFFPMSRPFFLFSLLRSFYKHVLGNPVDYTDLEAIEPEIFKSLKQILNLRLEDLGLELTFSAESHIFGIHEVRTALHCTVWAVTE